MRKTIAICLLLCSAMACRGADDKEQTPEDAVEPARKSVFLPPDQDVSPDQEFVDAAPRAPMAYAGTEGAFTVRWQMGKYETQHSVSIEQAALRIGDVPTLLYPIGHIKLDTVAWTVDPPHDGWTKTVVDRYFRDPSGAPIQLFFDLQTVGELDGSLATAGSEAKGRVIGTIQVDTRQQVVVFPAQFARPTMDTLVVRSDGPVPVDASVFMRQEHLESLKGALGLKRLEPKVTLEGEVSFTKSDEELLPTFIRVPVTQQTMTELRKRIDEEVDDFEAVQYHLRQQGVSKQNRDLITRDRFEALQKAAREARKDR